MKVLSLYQNLIPLKSTIKTTSIKWFYIVPFEIWQVVERRLGTKGLAENLCFRCELSPQRAPTWRLCPILWGMLAGPIQRTTGDWRRAEMCKWFVEEQDSFRGILQSLIPREEYFRNTVLWTCKLHRASNALYWTAMPAHWAQSQVRPCLIGKHPHFPLSTFHIPTFHFPLR